jgi:hypothetical protein
MTYGTGLTDPAWDAFAMENTQLKSLQHMQFTEFKTFLSSFQSK